MRLVLLLLVLTAGSLQIEEYRATIFTPEQNQSVCWLNATTDYGYGVEINLSGYSLFLPGIGGKSARINCTPFNLSVRIYKNGSFLYYEVENNYTFPLKLILLPPNLSLSCVLNCLETPSGYNLSLPQRGKALLKSPASIPESYLRFKIQRQALVKWHVNLEVSVRKSQLNKSYKVKYQVYNPTRFSAFTRIFAWYEERNGNMSLKNRTSLFNLSTTLNPGDTWEKVIEVKATSPVFFFLRAEGYNLSTRTVDVYPARPVNITKPNLSLVPGEALVLGKELLLPPPVQPPPGMVKHRIKIEKVLIAIEKIELENYGKIYPGGTIQGRGFVHSLAREDGVHIYIELPPGWNATEYKNAIVPQGYSYIPFELKIPEDAQPGIYTLKMVIEAWFGRAEKSFTVEVLPKEKKKKKEEKKKEEGKIAETTKEKIKKKVSEITEKVRELNFQVVREKGLAIRSGIAGAASFMAMLYHFVLPPLLKPPTAVADSPLAALRAGGFRRIILPIRVAGRTLPGGVVFSYADPELAREIHEIYDIPLSSAEAIAIAIVEKAHLTVSNEKAYYVAMKLGLKCTLAQE